MPALIVAVLATATVAVAGGGTAGALPPTCPGSHDDVDLVRADTGSTGKVDFGGDPHLFGAPQGNAKICWDRTGGGKIFAELDGQLYWDDLFAGGCAEVQVDFFDAAGRFVGASLSAGSSVKSSGGLRQVQIWRQAEAPNLDRIRIRLFRSNSSCAGDVLVGTINARFGD